MDKKEEIEDDIFLDSFKGEVTESDAQARTITYSVEASEEYLDALHKLTWDQFHSLWINRV